MSAAEDGIGKPRHKGAGLRALERLLPGVAGEALKKRGFGEYGILNAWESVVGAHLARYSAPVRIVFERGKTADGVLHIQVAPMMALEFQHMQPIILDRIAAYFGYRAVSRLVLLQSPHIFAPKRAEAPVAAARRASAPQIEAALSGCEDDDLRQSLQMLAKAVFSTPVAS
jgi:hypothetical protein